jgi:hypothetical protein
MRLIVDANVLVGHLLRAAGRRLLADPALDLLMAEDAWEEARVELPRRVARFARARHRRPGGGGSRAAALRPRPARLADAGDGAGGRRGHLVGRRRPGRLRGGDLADGGAGARGRGRWPRRHRRAARVTEPPRSGAIGAT